MQQLFARVIVDISHENLDKAFSYIIPEALYDKCVPGVRVKIPFGKNNREITGYILSIESSSDYPVDKLKSIISIETDNRFSDGKLIMLAEWMRVNYGSTMINALKTALPVKKNVRELNERTIELALSKDAAYAKLDFYKKKHQVARQRLLEELINEQSLDYVVATKKLNIPQATITLMAEQGVLRVSSKRVYRNNYPIVGEYVKTQLNEDQQYIVDDFVKDLNKNDTTPFLIHGITGSGKTEVYMEMIDHVIRSGREAIVLIPEIALTYQTVLRFYKRFGNRVSNIHSRLSQGERYDQFERAKKGEISVMIGPRSALFTPFRNLGLVIIDEEHEGSYKSDSMPKYHAREVAEKLCELHGAKLVMGSATPSMNSYFEAKNGNYHLHTMKKRAKENAALPACHIVDLREELKSGNRSIFSKSLADAIDDRLLRQEQIMLFINRRGLDGAISCRACGKAVKCPHCDISLSRHKNGRLMCHYCGYEQADIDKCPECGSKYISGMGAGTEKVVEAISKQFPHARVLRMDYDTTRAKGSYDDILSGFANHEADILVGTQMIVKGHDFPNVTLMGILVADKSLNAGDYRASERTFQLLVQAAGRAGRGERPGDVYIQTYQPEHYAILRAANQDYEAFYEEEIAYRSMVGYPPAGHMLAILVESGTEEIASEFSTDLAEDLKSVIINSCEKGEIRLIGPTKASIGRLNDMYRYVVYVKSQNTEKLIAIKDESERYESSFKNQEIRISFDLDPMSGY